MYCYWLSLESCTITLPATGGVAIALRLELCAPFPLPFLASLAVSLSLATMAFVGLHASSRAVTGARPVLVAKPSSRPMRCTGCRYQTLRDVRSAGALAAHKLSVSLLCWSDCDCTPNFVIVGPFHPVALQLQHFPLQHVSTTVSIIMSQQFPWHAHKSSHARCLASLL